MAVARTRSKSAAPRGAATIKKAVEKIRRTVEEYEGSKAADAAVKALILAVPLRKNIAEYKKDLREALIRDRGNSADERKYVAEAMKKGRPGAYIKAEDIADGYWQFEGDLMLIHGGRFGGTEHSGEVIYLKPEDISLSAAMAVDNNMESVPVSKAVDAIIEAYAYGSSTRNPYYEAPSSRRRY